MPKIIVTDTMNDVANMFSTSITLVCKHHISKIARVRCKTGCKVKYLKLKKVKSTDLCNTSSMLGNL